MHAGCKHCSTSLTNMFPPAGLDPFDVEGLVEIAAALGDTISDVRHRACAACVCKLCMDATLCLHVGKVL